MRNKQLIMPAILLCLIPTFSNTSDSQDIQSFDALGALMCCCILNALCSNTPHIPEATPSSRQNELGSQLSRPPSDSMENAHNMLKKEKNAKID